MGGKNHAVSTQCDYGRPPRIGVDLQRNRLPTAAENTGLPGQDAGDLLSGAG
jgi:hypothetical protein